MAPVIGDVLWTPPADVRQTTEIGRFLTWLRDERGHDLAGYDELWRWSVDDLEGFWGAIWDFFEVRAHAPYERVLGRREMPGAEWFPGARVNYAGHVFQGKADDDLAIQHASESRELGAWTWGELREQRGQDVVGLLMEEGRRAGRARRVRAAVAEAREGGHAAAGRLV